MILCRLILSQHTAVMMLTYDRYMVARIRYISIWIMKSMGWTIFKVGGSVVGRGGDDTYDVLRKGYVLRSK